MDIIIQYFQFKAEENGGLMFSASYNKFPSTSVPESCNAVLLWSSRNVWWTFSKEVSR